RRWEPQVARASHLQPIAVRSVDCPNDDGLAIRASQNRAHDAAIEAQTAHCRGMAACVALRLRARYFAGEEFLKTASGSVAVHHEVRHVVGHGVILPTVRSVPS